MAENKSIVFEKGIYKITDTIQIESGQTIDLNGATLRRYCSKPVLMTKADKNTINYEGARNIVIKNGTIEGMNGLGYNPSNLVALFHADNVIFENVCFLDATGSHCIDIVGCRNVTIHLCDFCGYCSDGHDFRESIQIDFAYAGGLPYFPSNARCYDMTRCKNITIAACMFHKSKTYPAQYTAIGTHEQANDDLWHENIYITDNVAAGNGLINGNGFFLRVMNFANVVVSGNNVQNYGRFVVTTPATCLRNYDGSKVEIEKTKNTAKNVEITNNNVLLNGYRYTAYAVYIDEKNVDARNVYVSDFNSSLPLNAVYVKCKNGEVDLWK